jgi:eukaryotic-like serine/threonine-protein kinase
VQSGELIANRYELQRELGEGGMATVWLAQDRTLERPVAIKFLDVGARDRTRMGEQFLREARIAAAVRHRNVIQILDFGMHLDTPFMAMEALAGETMADRFDRGEQFELREVIEIAARCLEGLAAVHEAGIVHRDLKPENIFLVREATGVYPKLLDFGISKNVDKRSGRHSAIPTESGRVIGTPEYMSPEQARGMHDLDRRADIYGLGVVMYEALTGRLPYDAEHMGDVLIQVIAGGAPDVVTIVPAVGHPISDVIARAMQREREHRFHGALEMRSALLEAALPLLAEGHDPISLPPVRRDAKGRDSAFDTKEASLPVDAIFDAAVASERAPRGVRVSAAMIAAAVTVSAGLIAAAAFALGAFRQQAQHEPAPRYIVVQGAPAAPAAAAATASPAMDSAPALAAASERVSTAQPEPRDDARTNPAAVRKPRTAQPGSSDPSAALASAFDRQKGPVVECLNQHADQVAERVQMAVRLTLGADGQVQAVEVLPDQIAATHVGSCIARAVRGMRFGAQPAPISIRVPLTARRSSGVARSN